MDSANETCSNGAGSRLYHLLAFIFSVAMCLPLLIAVSSGMNGNELARKLKRVHKPETAVKKTANKTVAVVVSRCWEDIRWTNELNNSTKLIIYNRGEDLDYEVPGAILKLSNFPFGRETHTMLYHILANYDDLPDWTVFAQGDPFPHSPNFINLVNSGFEKSHLPGLKCLTCEYRSDIPGGDKQGCKASNNEPVMYKISSLSAQVLGAPFDSGVANFMKQHSEQTRMIKDEMIARILKMIGMYRGNGHLDFCYSAIFAVHRDNILQHPKNVYEKLMQQYFDPPVESPSIPLGDSPNRWNCSEPSPWCRGKPYLGYIYERLWVTIFSKLSQKK